MMSRIKIPSKRAFKIALVFVFFAGIFIATYTFLSRGIKIEQFALAGSKIEGFYLRLDKKLILEVESLYLKTSKESKNIEDFSISTQVQAAKNIHFILQYFQKIKIKKLYLNDFQAHLFYDGDDFIFNLPEFYVRLNLAEQSSNVLIRIHDLYLKRYGVYYQGEGKYDLRRRDIQLDGILSVIDRDSYQPYIRCNLNMQSDLKTLKLKGSSDVFYGIEFLRPLLPPFKKKNTEAWIFDNYTIESAQINDFSVEIPFKSNHLLKDALKSLTVIVSAKNGEVIFNPQLQPAHADSVQIVFQNNSLEFYPKSATYLNHHANAKVVIKNLIGNNTSLELHLDTNSPLDSDILQVLKSYNISLPIEAPSANIAANLFINFHFSTHTIHTKGFFKSQDSTFFLSQLPLKFATLNVDSTNLQYQNFLNADTHFTINVQDKSISGDMFVKDLVLIEPEILKITDHALPFYVDFKESKAPLISLPTFNVEANLSTPYSFAFNELKDFVPFSKILQDYNITDGRFQLTTQDFKEYSAKISATTTQKILLDRQNQPIPTLNATLYYSPEKFILESVDSTFKYQKTPQSRKITFKDVNISLDKENSQDSDKKDSTPPLLADGINTNLIFKERTILSDSFAFKIAEHEIQGTLKHKNGIANFHKRGDSISLEAKEFGDDFLNTLAEKNIFNKGRFAVSLNTNEKGILIGQASLLNTSINQLNILQNLLAFIDTIPSLLSFKIPGFNQDGYYVKDGIVHFGLRDDFLAIDKLEFNGSSIDIKGQGVVQIDSKAIDFNAELITVKSLSGLINKIPVVNYILLGENGQIATNFKINGTLDKPQIQTQTAQDLLLSPFNILKRAFKSPFEIFN